VAPDTNDRTVKRAARHFVGVFLITLFHHDVHSGLRRIRRARSTTRPGDATYLNMPDQLKIDEYAILPAGLIRKTIADSLFVSPTTRSFPEVPASDL
jgi:hypothetical protein